MSIRYSEINIESGKPFANCKLDRAKYANILTDIIDAYPAGFVLAINNKWGTGKTTFVKMWKQDLDDREYKTVYFNAWENDFENNPLTALMGELKTLTKVSTEKAFTSTLKKAAALSKNIAPIVAKAIVDRYIDTKEVQDAIVGITKGVSDVFENEVNEYAKKKIRVQDFRNNLTEFVTKTNNGKPIIFIIDELDRCRPNYAVSILEQIKHFFSVPNIVFVLSIDKVQLGNAICGVYGSDNIDSEEYLRRFIDIEYSIPEPESESFYKYLYDYLAFDEFLNAENRIQNRELHYDKREFLEICKLLFSNSYIPLRQQEKMFSLARLSLRTLNDNNYLVPFAYMFLIFIKFAHNDFYEKLKAKKLSFTQLQEGLLKVFKNNINEKSERQLIRLEAYILKYYNNFINTHYKKQAFYERNNSTNELVPKINSIINENLTKELISIFEGFERGRNESDLDLGYFINKIELLDTLKL